MTLSPEQRDDLRRLLASELRAAWRTALAGGAAPDALAHLVDERRQAVNEDEPAHPAERRPLGGEERRTIRRNIREASDDDIDQDGRFAH